MIAALTINRRMNGTSDTNPFGGPLFCPELSTRSENEHDSDLPLPLLRKYKESYM